MIPKQCDFKEKCLVDMNYSGDVRLIVCDKCFLWFHICCDTKLDPKKLPDNYFCPNRAKLRKARAIR